MRLLIFLGLIYLAYRVAKSKLIQSGFLSSAGDGGSAAEIDNEMIKDPFCGVYFPKKDGVHLRWEGESLYFCSPDCRDGYEEAGKAIDE